MRLTCQPLSAPAHQTDDQCPILSDGRQVGALWRQRLNWTCRDAELRVTVLAAEAVRLPTHEPSEPTAGAIARLNRSVAAVGGLLLLENPAAFAERVALTAGVRLFATTTDADVAVWDAALSLGQPVYGVRGTVVCQAIRPDAYAVLSALAYGNVVCEDGLSLAHCDESPTSVALTGHDELSATVIIRDGFEAAALTGKTIRWQDRGNEGYVRLVARAPNGGTCWTQPRFVAQRAGGGKPGESSGGGSCGS